MKVAIKDIKPNPYRYINKGYPIDKAKVDRLRASIKRTGFWDNLVGRKNAKGEIEIAYGHHRLEALRHDFDPDYEIELNVRDLDNATMLKIMAAENDTMDIMSPAVINETVRAAMEFLADDLKVIYHNAHCQDNSKRLTGSVELQGAIERSKLSGKSSVEQLIGEFLDWPHRRVKEAIAALHAFEEGVVTKEEYEKLPTQWTAEAFRRETKKLGFTPEQRKAFAKRLIDDEVSVRGVNQIAREIKQGKKQALTELEINDVAQNITQKLLDASVSITEEFVKNCHHIDEKHIDALAGAVKGVVNKLRTLGKALGNEQLVIEGGRNEKR